MRRDHGIGRGSGEAGGAYHRLVGAGTKLGRAHLRSYVTLSHQVLEGKSSIAVLCGGSYLRMSNAEMRRRCARMCNG